MFSINHNQIPHPIDDSGGKVCYYSWTEGIHTVFQKSRDLQNHFFFHFLQTYVVYKRMGTILQNLNSPALNKSQLLQTVLHIGS